MILSTLPDIPGRTYSVIGVVFSSTLNRMRQSSRPAFSLAPSYLTLEEMFGILVQQASGMGADAIVDIKMTPQGDYVVAIGTAVKLR